MFLSDDNILIFQRHLQTSVKDNKSIGKVDDGS